jgi:PAS domain S-box-containing protein
VEKKIAELRKRLDDFYEASMTVKGDTSEILNKLLEKVAGILNGKFILVECRQGDEFILKAGHNLPEEMKKVGREPIKGSICAHVLDSGEPALIRNLPDIEPWRNYIPVHKYNLKTYLGVPILSHEGETIGTLCLLDDKDRDFTKEDIKVLTLFAQRASLEIEREELLSKLKESEERYRSFFEHAYDGILVVNSQDGKLLETNHRFQELFGYTKLELVDMKIKDLRPTEDATQFDKFTEGLFSEKVEFDDVPVRAKDGSVFFTDIAASMLALGGKKVFHCLVRDRTEKKKLLHQMICSERLASLGELSAAVAHEINNPMHTILAYSHLLLEDAKDNSKEKEWLQMMVGESTRVKKIVQGLLEFARRKESEFAEVSINKVIESIIPLIANQARTHNVQIEQDFGAVLPPVIADATQLQQVFVNIAINAIEAMEKGGTLTFDTHPTSDKSVEIKISDTGCGIAKENIPNVVEPFFSTKTKGTGLGLSVSHGIIMSHNGNIRVESQLDKGTTVVITLPLKEG